MNSGLARSVTADDVEGATHNDDAVSEILSPISPSSPTEPAIEKTEKGLTQSVTATSHRSTANRVLSRFRTADSIPLTPPPDGGVDAWLMTFMACLVNFNTWGFVNRYGIAHAHVESNV